MEEYALEQTYFAEVQRRELAKQMEQLANVRNGMIEDKEIDEEEELFEDDLDPIERLEAEFRRQVGKE